jgi:hypothetical protein
LEHPRARAFFGSGFIKVMSESIQALTPEVAAAREPPVRLVKPCWVETIDTPLRLSTRANQPRFAQHAQVARYGGARNWKTRGDLTRSHITESQRFDYFCPGGVRERRKNFHSDWTVT